MSTQQRLAKAKPCLPGDLLRSAAWVERPLQVELRETHISWVFLTERFAYKLKKPVNLGFLDFSTPERRHQACVEEVRLNRRLAPDTYLGVVPITRTSSGRFRTGGMGAPIDWAVKMHRLPDDRALSQLILDQRLDEAELQRLVNRLVCFYSSLPPKALRAEQYRAEIERHIQENCRELSDPRHGLPRAAVDRVHAAQRRFLHLAAASIDCRVCDGRIVEGHGDLRPEHIYLVGEPVIIDCVEFNPEFRRIDVLDEISFLAMECAMLGAASIGRRILTQFCNASGDRPGPRLLALYQSYRACVRAKVMALRADQLEGEPGKEASNAARRYLRLADEFANQLGPPLLIVVSGASGTGKSTIAAGLAEQLALVHLQTDAIRRELGRAPLADDRYSAESRAAVYDEMMRHAEQLLAQRMSVVVDGTFLQQSQLLKAQRLAAREGAQLRVVRCHCPSEVAHRRIRSRAGSNPNFSEATPTVHDDQVRRCEYVPDGVVHYDVDTTCDWSDTWQDLCAQLRADLVGFEGSPSGQSGGGELPAEPRRG